MINSMINEFIKVKIEGNKLGSFCEINLLIIFVLFVRWFINWLFLFLLKNGIFNWIICFYNNEWIV